MDQDITQLLMAASGGNAAAMDRLFTAIYDELKLLAHRQLAFSLHPTINTTGLVHETFLKIVRPEGLQLSNREHFFATASRAMRQIVIDRARRRLARKRHPGEALVALDEEMGAEDVDPHELVSLDSALCELQRVDPRLGELVELRFFAGLSVEQVAELRGVASRTVLRDWRRARAYLFDSMKLIAN